MRMDFKDTLLIILSFLCILNLVMTLLNRR